jgi:hypothetical protein
MLSEMDAAVLALSPSGMWTLICSTQRRQDRGRSRAGGMCIKADLEFGSPCPAQLESTHR